MSLPAAEDRLVQLNGLRFHYREWDNPGAQALVLLHGFTGHARSWDGFAAAMQHKYRVLALDQRGHGESEWAADYSSDAMVSDVEAFQRALGLKQFVLLGLSMGGRNAFQYAGTHPAEVQRLVIVDIGPVVAAAGGARIQAGVQAKDVFDTPEQAIAQMRAGNPLAPDEAIRHRGINNLMLREDGKWTWRYDSVLRDPNRPRPRPTEEDGWAVLRKITAPTLLIRGAVSDVLAPEAADRMVKEIPDCRLVTVQDSGHSVPLDNPPGFLQAVQTFL
jgi:pimeloyl-ACP methyl ester carboxylesterase